MKATSDALDGCGRERSGPEVIPGASPGQTAVRTGRAGRCDAGALRVCYKVFRSAAVNWELLFEEVARFASEVGPRRLIGISQPDGRCGFVGQGVVTVWYWGEGRGGPTT